MIDALLTEEPLEASTTRAFNGLQVTTRIIPAAGSTRGGDWCEAFALSEHVIAISIGDVCGHGDETFAAMIDIRREIRAAAFGALNPAQVLARANTACHQAESPDIATAVFALLNTRERSMTYANAGHPQPLMIANGDALFLENTAPDLPLGVDAGSSPALRVIAAPADSLFVFYTDGVIESCRDAMQGSVRLLSAANLASFVPEVSTAMAIEQLMQLTAANADDAAILTARTPHRPLVHRRFRKALAPHTDLREVTRKAP